MKKIIFAGILLLICFSSCTEDENLFMSNGTITGIDIRECSCCGGYFIDINDSTYRFYTIPAGSDVQLQNPNFPIYVKLDWAKADTVCLGDEIKVLRIGKR
ncbi:MAG TPA: hypothetical protein DHV28_10410 [Ignavibacteriales bacterium]|nr:hypothetical protein [Ignavibacteriales bacterium]